MDITPVSLPDQWTQIKQLFREYHAWVRDEHGLDLGFKGIEDEIQSLPEVYDAPGGCVLLALDGRDPAGCVALRPLQGRICEMKRMFVRPEYQGKGLGRALGMRIIQEARDRKYCLLRLDTADTMQAAQSLYRSLGFQPASRYYELPEGIVGRAVFMELNLKRQV